MLNKDYKDILSILSEEKVKFILVGRLSVDIIKNKLASARTKDLADVEMLKK